MAAYATVADVQARMSRAMTADEQATCGTLLDDAAIMIDSIAESASEDAKKIASCRMVIRAMGDGSPATIPTGATQGSMSGLGYSQSWTLSGGSTGELYLSKADRQLLGTGNRIGSYSPVQELTGEAIP